MNAYAYQTYKNVQVSTASQGELIIMLFDGAIRFSNQATKSIETEEYAVANEKLQRAQNIVLELLSALDMKAGDIATDLQQLYVFIHELLVKANMEKDTGLVDQAVNLLTEMRDMWREVVEQV